MSYSSLKARLEALERRVGVDEDFSSTVEIQVIASRGVSDEEWREYTDSAAWPRVVWPRQPGLRIIEVTPRREV